MANKQYKKDVAECEVFARFLDVGLYAPLGQILTKTPGSVMEVLRFTAMDPQYRGYDVCLKMVNGETGEGGSLPVDEKAQLHNINDPIPTFCFELSYLKDGVVRPGWFIDARKLTQAYLLCWPRGIKLNDGNIYTGATVRLLFKQDVADYVKAFGYDRDTLIQTAKEIRAAGVYGQCGKSWKHPDFYFHFTESEERKDDGELYGEKMINLIIKERRLEKLAAASLNIDYNPDTNCIDMTGYFGGIRDISESFPMPYNIYSLSADARQSKRVQTILKG